MKKLRELRKAQGMTMKQLGARLVFQRVQFLNMKLEKEMQIMSYYYNLQKSLAFQSSIY